MELLRTTVRRAGTAAVAFGAITLLVAGCAGSAASSAPSESTATSPDDVVGSIAVDETARAMLPADISDAGRVTVATDAPYAPFEFYVQEGSEELTGVDVLLGKAIGDKLGIDFDFAQQGFDGIIPALQAGNFDLTMSAMTSSVERMDVLTFVDYSASGTGILTKAGNPEGIESYLDLCGQSVAVQAATSQVDLAKTQWQPECDAAGLAPIELSEYPSDSDAQLAITAGKAVASLLTKPSAGFVAKTTNDGRTFEVIDDPEAPNGYDATLNGIGVLKANDALAAAIQAALQSLMDDGSYQKILAQFGVEGIGIEKATINGAAS